jgi:hypothetical protein
LLKCRSLVQPIGGCCEELFSQLERFFFGPRTRIAVASNHRGPILRLNAAATNKPAIVSGVENAIALPVQRYVGELWLA